MRWIAGEYNRMLIEPEYISRPYWAYSYLARGHYIEHVQRWLQFFSRTRCSFLRLTNLRLTAIVRLLLPGVSLESKMHSGPGVSRAGIHGGIL